MKPITRTLSIALPPALIAALWYSAHSGYRRPPTPRGMVFRVEVVEVQTPMDTILVEVGQLEPPTIAIETPIWTYIGNAGNYQGQLRTVYSFPHGEELRTEKSPEWHQTFVDGYLGFDFDGDGAVDSIRGGGTLGDKGFVAVVSGRDGRVLFEDRDDLEYENGNRAYALLDLDGDGCSELGLVHPRMNRGDYDTHPWDWILGAKSWVTVVSGRLATRE